MRARIWWYLMPWQVFEWFFLGGRGRHRKLCPLLCLWRKRGSSGIKTKSPERWNQVLNFAMKSQNMNRRKNRAIWIRFYRTVWGDFSLQFGGNFSARKNHTVWTGTSTCNLMKKWRIFEQSLFSIKCSFEWVYFRAGKPHGWSSINDEKIVKNHLWEDMTILRRRGCLATKININFFVRNKVLNIFHVTIFSIKNNIFQQNIIFGRHDHFSGNWVLDNKNECNLCYGKWSTEYSFEIFTSKNSILAEWKPKNQFWGQIFPHISGFIRPIVSKQKKNRVYPCADSHQLCEFHENLYKTTTYIVTVIIIINWKSRSVIF